MIVPVQSAKRGCYTMPKWTSGQARKETSVEDVNTCPHQHPGRLSQTRTVVVERDCDSPVSGGDDPDSPPLPLPPPNPDNIRRSVLGSFGALRIGAITPRGAGPRSLVSTRSSPTGSQSGNEGYNSSDEHMPCFPPSRPGSTSTWIESRYKLLLRLSKNIRLIMQVAHIFYIYIYKSVIIYGYFIRVLCLNVTGAGSRREILRPLLELVSIIISSSHL